MTAPADLAYPGTVIAWTADDGERVAAILAAYPPASWLLSNPDGSVDSVGALPAGWYAIENRDGWARARCGCGGPLSAPRGGGLACAWCDHPPTWAELREAERYGLWDDVAGQVWVLPAGTGEW